MIEKIDDKEGKDFFSTTRKSWTIPFRISNIFGKTARSFTIRLSILGSFFNTTMSRVCFRTPGSPLIG